MEKIKVREDRMDHIEKGAYINGYFLMVVGLVFVIIFTMFAIHTWPKKEISEKINPYVEILKDIDKHTELYEEMNKLYKSINKRAVKLNLIST